MNNDITVNTKTYKLTAPDGSGVSRRLDSSTGLNTPITLTIGQSKRKDGSKEYHLTQVRLSLPVPVKGGTEMQEMSIQASLKVPTDSSVDYTVVEPLVNRMLDLVNNEAIRDDLFENRLS